MAPYPTATASRKKLLATRSTFGAPLGHGLPKRGEQTSRWRRAGLGEGSIDLGREVVLRLIPRSYSHACGPRLLPEPVYVAASHQVRKGCAQFCQLDRAGLVGDLLEVEDEIAVVVLLGPWR